MDEHWRKIVHPALLDGIDGSTRVKAFRTSWTMATEPFDGT
jgi:hypothetical protein